MKRACLLLLQAKLEVAMIDRCSDVHDFLDIDF
jgi:hypothetical protein